MGQPISLNSQIPGQTLAAPNSVPGTTVVGPTGTRYTANASGQATILPQDVQAVMGYGWTPVYTSVTLASPGWKPGVSFTAPSGTTYTAGPTGTAIISAPDVAYALQNGWSANIQNPFVTGETIGSKLRRALARANAQNPWNTPPLVAEPTWATNTAYVNSAQVVQNGYVYVAVNNPGGTSSAAGVGPQPTQGLSTIAQIDGTGGTVYWTYQRSAETTSSDPSAPTVARSASASVSATNHVVSPLGGTAVGGVPATSLATAPYSFSVGHIFYGGGYSYFGANSVSTMNMLNSSLGYSNTGTVVASSLQNGIAAWNPQTAGSNFGVANSANLIFWTDASTITVQMNPGGVSVSPTQLLVGDESGERFYQRNTLPQLATTGAYYNISFTTKKPRKIKLRCQHNLALTGIYTAATDTVWAPQRSDMVTAVFHGSSIFAGAGAYSSTSAGSAVDVMCDLLGWENPVNSSVSGTGFYVASASGQSILNRITDFTWMQPDVIMMQVGYNDIGNSTAATIQSALSQFVSTVRAQPGCATTVIIISSCYVANQAITLAQSQQMEGWIQQGIAAVGDSLTYFIPMSTDPSPYVFGTGYALAGHQIGDGNADYVLGSVGLHPTPYGSVYLGYRWARSISQIISQIQ